MSMQSITFKHEQKTAEELHEEADQHGFDTRSDYLRHIINQRGEADRVREEYEQKIADLRTEHDRELDEYDQKLNDLQMAHERKSVEHERKLTELEEIYEQEIAQLEQDLERIQREKRMILEQREEHESLVKVVQEEQSLAKRKAEAPIWRRWKWSITGMPND